MSVLVLSALGSQSGTYCFGASLTDQMSLLEKTDWYEFREQLGSTGYGGLSMAQGPGSAAFQIVPMLSLSERYDSNVFIAPKVPGLKREDYVSHASPQLFVRSQGRIIDATLLAGATSEYYVNNPSLGYVGYNGNARLDFSSLVQRIAPKASLQVSDSVQYTPVPPAFVTGNSNLSQIVGPEATNELPQSQVFLRGVQLSRVNTFSNSTGISGAMPLSPRASLNGSYTYSFIQFGTPAVNQSQTSAQQSVFRTDIHTASIGPSYQISPRDIVNAAYTYTLSEYGAGQGSFETHSGTVGWGRAMAGDLTMRLYAGATTIQARGGGQSSSIGGSNGRVTYTGGASLTWIRGFSSVSISYSGGVYPSYYQEAGPMLSNSLSISATHRPYNRMFIFGSLNYGQNTVLGQTGSRGAAFEFQTYSGSVGVGYRVTQWMNASLTESFTYYRTPFATGAFGTPVITDFTRNVIMFSLTMYMP